ncbi:MAG: hypothetical protein A07HR60_02429 [uncultured archaeon A07HR60]|nr:MAG: hypothetical protein A07HR60_02429 [uncultured archaeon A07HR60]
MSSGTDWDTNAVEYSGDIAVSGDETPPVGIESPEDVYILPHSIEGDLKIVNAEYVFADVPTGDTVNDPTPETEITGSLEDAYYQPHGVTGDAILVDPEDVFIAQNAVEGQLQVVGDEQRFYEDQASPQFPYAQLDETVVGWQQSATITEPRVGAAVSGYDNSLAIEEAEHDLDIYVLGSEHEVRVTSQVGREMSVNVFFVGINNTVSTGPYVDVTVANESGTDNTATQDSFPVDRLIEQTETEAYSEAGFGRAQVTYQQLADTDDEYCPNCGCVDVTIIERRQRDALFVFGSPVYTYDDGGVSYECEECSPRGSPRVELTPDERRELFS